jgi:hypothetical protein
MLFVSKSQKRSRSPLSPAGASVRWVAESLCVTFCFCIVVSVPTVLTATQSFYSINNSVLKAETEHCREGPSGEYGGTYTNRDRSVRCAQMRGVVARSSHAGAPSRSSLAPRCPVGLPTNIPPSPSRRESALGCKKGRLASALVGIASVR